LGHPVLVNWQHPSPKLLMNLPHNVVSLKLCFSADLYMFCG